MYLLQKTIQRNKAVFAAAAAVLAALCLGLGLSTWLFFQERAARQEAELDKASEAKWRARDEATQQISRAAEDWDAGNYAEAVALAAQIPPDSLPSSLEAAKVFRNIVAWHAMHEHWSDAVISLRSLLKVDQYRNYASPAAGWDLLAAGVCFAEIVRPQDLLQYEQFRHEAIRLSASTEDSLAAERLLRSSLLLSANQETLQSLAAPAQTVEKSLSSSDPGAAVGSGEAPWRLVSLALLEYRRGDWAKAAAWCQSLPSADTNPARLATARLILAMCSQRLGKTGEAVAELKQGRETVEAKFHTGLTAGSDADGYWFDWAMARILLREAAGLIKT
jgi:hypothetical protein